MYDDSIKRAFIDTLFTHECSNDLSVLIEDASLIRKCLTWSMLQ